MKTKGSSILVSLALLAISIFKLQPSTALAQGTAFTYQGQLQINGRPADGLYDFQFSLFDAPGGGSQVGGTVTNLAVGVMNGLFTTTLDLGPVFTGNAAWLMINVRTNGVGNYIGLNPRQLLTPTPYAITAASASNLLGTLPAAQLSGTISNSTLPPGPIFSGTVTAGSFSGNGVGLTNLNADMLGGFTSGTFWKTNGNVGANPSNGAFLGTADNQPLELRVNNLRTMRLEPNASGPNIIGGYPGNLVDGGAFGATISGGGVAGFVNHISSTLGTISGGSGNVIQTNANDSVIVGGRQNEIDSGNWRAFIGGGSGNLIQGGSNPGSGVSSTSSSSIVGGWGNTILSNAYESAIGGGAGNSIGSVFSTIAGGRNNSIAASANDADIAGGVGNAIQYSAYNSFIGGGYTNLIATNAYRAVIGGGTMNLIQTNSSHAVIVGGQNNQVQPNAWNSFIGGGFTNIIQSGAPYATIVGGSMNTIQINSTNAFIGGGVGNMILSDNRYSTIGGGYDHLIGTNSRFATISGGDANTIQAQIGCIGGGWNNQIPLNGYIAAIGGGFNNQAGGQYSAVLGGSQNFATGNYSAIGGGLQNHASGAESVVTGGYANTANNQFAAVGGGSGNQALGAWSMVPGGISNIAGGDHSFAAGSFAQATNTAAFVWGDGSTNTSSTASNQFMARASGGVVFYTSTDTNTGVSLAAGSGSWSSLSDRNAKDDFTPVDSKKILERVAAMSLNTWHYKAQDKGVRHLGPVAQDFYAAFGVGEDERHITTIDSEGVALAAIQGLNLKLQDELKRQDAENVRLKQQNDSLMARLDELEAAVKQLAANK